MSFCLYTWAPFTLLAIQMLQVGESLLLVTGWQILLCSRWLSAHRTAACLQEFNSSELGTPVVTVTHDAANWKFYDLGRFVCKSLSGWNLLCRKPKIDEEAEGERGREWDQELSQILTCQDMHCILSEHIYNRISIFIFCILTFFFYLFVGGL